MLEERVSPAAGYASLLQRRVDAAPDEVVAAFPDERLTARELDELTQAMARRLVAAGVTVGDRVGVMLPSGSSTFVALLFGIARAGGVAVCVNARYKADELAYLEQHAQLVLLVADPRYDEVVAAAGLACPVVDPEAPAFRATDTDATDADVRAASEAVDLDTPGIILYTSGTTARPKGVELGHRGLIGQAKGFADRLDLTAQDRFWTPLPLFHIAGITVLIASLHAGALFVHVGWFEPERALEQLEAERATVAFPAFETIWNAVLYHPRFERTDLSHLRRVTALGTPARLRQMQSMLPDATIVTATGSTESGGFLCLGHGEDTLEQRTTTAGRPIPGMEVRVIDPETGDEVPPGTDGELTFRGVWRLLRYHADPAATAAAIDADGWFHSGDVVCADAEGRVAYVGRYKDMLKVGGENVAAAEIEDFIAQHPAVALVQVVSAPDPRYTEVPAAYVRLQEGATATEDELIEFCRGRISGFKVPRHVRFVDEWPLAGEKIAKRVLREWIAAELETPTQPRTETPHGL